MDPIIFDLNELEKENTGFSYYILGRSYDLEENGANKDYKRALYWYQKGENINYPLCLYSIGISYVLGLGDELDIDKDKGQKILTDVYPKIIELIESNETPKVEKLYARFVMGAYYYFGLGSIKKDYRKAFEIIKECADEGHIAAIYDLGANFYYYGNGTDVNYELSQYYLDIANNAGLKRAEETLKSRVNRDNKKIGKEIKDADFESVIPTALHTAYPLVFTDILYSQEIFDKLSEHGFDESIKNDKLVFELEARHKLIDKFVKETGIKQILELASGFTASGLNICNSDKDVKYVEFDLPQVIYKKQQILKEITQIPDNMFFVGGNALRFEDLEKVLNIFDINQPIAIVNQGLLRYLDFEEKQIVTENIYKLISTNNGAWITCDFTPAKYIQSQNKNLSIKASDNYNSNLSKITNRNNTSWRFKDKEAVEEFLDNNNLKIEWHSFTESVDMLSSREKFNLTKEEVLKYLENAYVGIIKVKYFR